MSECPSVEVSLPLLSEALLAPSTTPSPASPPTAALPQADAVDRHLLHELAASAEAGRVRAVVTVDDGTGALTLGAADLAESVAATCDSWRDESRLRRAVLRTGDRPGNDPWDGSPAPVQIGESVADALAAVIDADPGRSPHVTRDDGETVVLARLPKGLAALDELAEAVAASAPSGTTLLVGGRDKFLAPAMTDVLRSHFGSVRATLGRQKCRALVARDPLPRAISYPRHQRHPDLDLVVCAHGAAFAGTRVDRATRLLLAALTESPAGPERIIDLGCGTGVLAVVAARHTPTAQVLALDDSRAAVLSARATTLANDLGDRILARQADGLREEPTGSADRVVCNPPFHRGTTKDSSTAFAMIGDAGRVLRPGGDLWLVFNAHLPYLPALRRQVGATRIVARDLSYVVTRSVRAARA